MQSPLELINEHYQVILNKDIIGIADKYFPSEQTYVILEGPRLTTIGYEKIKKGWTDFCNSPLRLISIEWLEGPFVQQTAAMAYVAGIIKFKIGSAETVFENTFRTTFVLMQHEGKWKIQHEHVSIAHPDPYGIGDWLKKT